MIKSCTEVLNYYAEEHEDDQNNTPSVQEENNNEFYKCLFSIEVLEDKTNMKFI